MGYHTGSVFGIGTGTGMFNDYPDVAQLQQAYLFAEKAAQTCGCGFDWGFRFDYIYGTDGQDAQAIGSEPGNWDTSWDAGRFYGHAIPQAYLEVAYNNVKVKAGKFYTIIGYESVPAVNNFFYSHSFSMLLPEAPLQPKLWTIQPYTHTGFLAEYSPNCQTTLYGGWTAGWDTGFDQYGGGDTFLGGVSHQFNDAMSVDYSVIMGDFGQIDPIPGLPIVSRTSDSDGYLHSVVFDWDITSRLNYLLQTNYGDKGRWYDINATDLRVGNGKVFSLHNYLLYTINCQWAVGTRLEWLKYGGTVEYAAYTIGANYRPHPNMVLRPELRVDEYDILPDQTTFGIDAIITF